MKTVTTKPPVPLEIREAFDLRNAGRLDEAISAFERALARFPDHSKAWRVLGGLYWDRHEYRRAAACFKRAVELRPRSEDCSLGLFHTLLDAGDVPEARTEATRFLREVDAGANCLAETINIYRNIVDDDGSLEADLKRRLS